MHSTNSKGGLCMEEKKKKFISPEVELIKFTGEDIITVSVVQDKPSWYLDEEDPDGDNF